MARNKYPEITKTRILDAAQKLFIQYGYEHTTIQNILDELKDLSKGAIYHHFRSKEEIIDAVLDRMYGEGQYKIRNIQNNQECNGKEKLQQLIQLSLNNPYQLQILSSAPDLFKNPYFMRSQFQENIEVSAPQIVEPIIREGIEDGSIKTEYPKEMAEVMMLLLNFWLNPMALEVTSEELVRKYQFLKEMSEKMGLPIINDSILDKVEEFRSVLEKVKQNKREKMDDS